jgi:hypothetical protein
LLSSFLDRKLPGLDGLADFSTTLTTPSDGNRKVVFSNCRLSTVTQDRRRDTKRRKQCYQKEEGSHAWKNEIDRVRRGVAVEHQGLCAR